MYKLIDLVPRKIDLHGTMVIVLNAVLRVPKACKDAAACLLEATGDAPPVPERAQENDRNTRRRQAEGS